MERPFVRLGEARASRSKSGSVALLQIFGITSIFVGSQFPLFSTMI